MTMTETNAVLTEEVRELVAGKTQAELMDMVDDGVITIEQLDALTAEEEAANPTKKKGSRKTRKYEGDTKEVKCNFPDCETMVTVTKFATPSKVFCEEHKPAKSGGSKAKYEGSTKVVNCVDCGVEVEVTKFATPANVRCDVCKANHRKNNKVVKIASRYIGIGEAEMAQLEALRADKVLAIRNTTIDDVVEISAPAALLTFLEGTLGLTQYDGVDEPVAEE